MPGQTGFELADVLSLRQSNLPVLFITGGLYSDDSRAHLPQRHILQKPYTARTLLASVN